MIPLYILGMLPRFGPRHGCQIKKLLSEQMADFTDIKLPALYYHLEKREAYGLITAQNVKEGVRPEKQVYEVRKKGKEKFHRLLRETLDLQYRPSFPVDGALFFSDYLDTREFLQSLGRPAAHRSQVVPGLPLRCGQRPILFSRATNCTTAPS